MRMRRKRGCIISFLAICIIIVIRLIWISGIKYIKYDKTQNYIENKAGNQIYIKDYFLIDGLLECIGIVYSDGRVGYIRDQVLKEVEIQDLTVPVIDDIDLKYYSSQRGGWYYNDKKSIFFYNTDEEKEYELYRSETETNRRDAIHNTEYRIMYFKINEDYIYVYEEVSAMLNAGRIIVYDIEKNDRELFKNSVTAFDISDNGKKLVYSCVSYTGIAYDWDISEYDLETDEILSNYKSTGIIRYIYYKKDSYEIYTVTNNTSAEPFFIRKVIKDTFLALKIGELQWNEELLQIK